MRVAIAALVLAGCASVPTLPPSGGADGAFTIDGRLSARRGGEAVAASFAWRHAPPRDDLVVTTPLGQAVAEISGDASTARYVLVAADGRRDDASGWAELTTRALGAPLPVDGLAAWIVGAPRPGAPFSVERDATGRAISLRQDGWEIVYAYAGEDARLPSRLQLARDDVEVRIVVVARR